MNDMTALAFPIDDDSPLVQYSIAFRKKPILLAGGKVVGSSEIATSEIFTGITEALEDDIKWELHVDEADKLDYVVAVSSGVLSGLIDVFFVGEFSLDRAREWGKERIEKIVMKVAHMEGYSGDNLNDAIKTLENNHPLAADGNANDFGGGLHHHFRDFSHHFSIGGLFFSILTQFTGMVVGTNLAGNLIIKPIPESHRQYIGKNFQEKLAFGPIEWFFHMVSDMAGSSGSLMGGTGVPGPLLSFMKELSALPFFKDSVPALKSNSDDMGFRLWVMKLFNGTMLADHDEAGKIIKGTQRRFDLRTEIGILGEVGRQTISVLVNQCVVRGFYFCRRACREIRDLGIHGISDLERIAPEDVLPWGTPAMRRMITVSSGVFTGVDLADAAVRSLRTKEPVTFFLRINYVGVATFVVACVVDIRATRADRHLEEGENPEDAYERSLSDLGCLKLDFQRTRILHSLMRATVEYDIGREKHDRRVLKKKAWLNEWSGRIAETVSLAWAADAGYFIDANELYASIDNLLRSEEDDSWFWLVAMEAIRFKAYIPLHGDNDKSYKGLKVSSDYFGDVFCKRQHTVDIKGLHKLDKAIGGTRSRLDGTVTKRIVGAAGTVVVVVATGGLAFYFAPAIAPILAAALGAEAATLSGAALTSASLAFLGGGAIAVGGAGMAGGTMLIVGGGALLGAVGCSGISTVTSMALATDGGYVLDECAKLVTFCREVLINRYGDLTSVAGIYSVLNQRIVELEVEIEAIKRGVSDDEIPADNDDEIDDKEEISPKKMIKVLNRSLKFMRHSSDEIAKAIRTAPKKQLVLPRMTVKGSGPVEIS